MSDSRYIRQTTLEEFGSESQQKLKKAKVLVVGAGGLGIPVLQYLTAMGVGTIGIVENDLVDISNLQRQVIYKESDVGQPKIYAALNRLKDLNSETKFLPFKTFLTRDNVLKIIEKFDLVVDASDNFPTRYLVNDACVILNKPFVYGALHGFEGQVSVFNFNNGPTYRCIFPEQPKEDEIPDCDENGVLGVIPGIIGTLQALEAVKVITEIGDVVSKRLLLYDGLNQSFNSIKFELNPENKEISNLKNDYGFIGCDLSKSISAKEFMDKILTKEKIKILDVRSESEYNDGNIKDSINMPIEKIQEQFRSTNLVKQSEFYVICQSGNRSKKAVSILESEFPNRLFINVEGGYNALNTSRIFSKYHTVLK